MGAVASLLAMDRTTLTAALKPLERRGLVAVTVNPGDKRSRPMTLTPAELALLADAVPSGSAHIRRSTLCLTRAVPAVSGAACAQFPDYSCVRAGAFAPYTCRLPDWRCRRCSPACPFCSGLCTSPSWKISRNLGSLARSFSTAERTPTHGDAILIIRSMISTTGMPDRPLCRLSWCAAGRNSSQRLASVGQLEAAPTFATGAAHSNTSPRRIGILSWMVRCLPPPYRQPVKPPASMSAHR
jgi:hypothetical protein